MLENINLTEMLADPRTRNDMKRSLQTMSRVAAKQLTPEEFAELVFQCDLFFCDRGITEELEIADSLPLMLHDLVIHGEMIDEKSLAIAPAYGQVGHNLVISVLSALVLLRSARNNGYGKEILIKAYKLFYKKEYNQLKKFTKINADTLISLSYNNGDFNIKKCSRILTYASLMDIEIDTDCILQYRAIEAMNQCEGDFGKVLKNTCYDDEDETGTKEALAHLNNPFEMESRDDAEKFLSFALATVNLPNRYIKDMYKDSFQEMLDRCYINSWNMIRNIFPEKADSMDSKEVAYCSIIKMLVEMLDDAIYKLYADASIALGCVLPVDIKYKLDENVLPSALPKKEEARSILPKTDAVDTNTDNLLAEISDLKLRLTIAEKNLKAEKEMEITLRKQMELQQKIIASRESEHEELAKLREYVYNLTEEDEPADNGADVASLLKGRKVTIVGGNPNWVKKLKNLYPEWSYVPANITVADPRAVESSEMVIFFTDALCHSSYGTYVRYCREHDIKFGYLHGVNIERCLAEIARQLTQ